MPSSIFEQRAHQFAEDIDDSTIKAQIEHYLRQGNFVGPVVTVVGAKGRGKSTLFSKATRVASSPTAKVQFAGTSAWKKSVNELRLTDSAFHSADHAVIGDALLCDAPDFTSAEGSKIVSSLLSITDFAVMTVQITQPAGADELAFVQKHLVGIPSVLVLTKCDQTEEDDFQEGLEAILENYGEFPWVAVLLSDRGERVAEQAASGRSLVEFEQWWRDEGHQRVEEAHEAHLNRLRQGWRDQARQFLDEKEQKYAPHLMEVRSSLASSSSAAQALRLQDELMDGLKTLPDKALGFYKSRQSDLRLRVSHVSNRVVDQIKEGGQVDHSRLEQDLSAVYCEWSQEARDYVHDEIKTTVERLYEVAVSYEELIRSAIKLEESNEVAEASHHRQEAFSGQSDDQRVTALEGNFDLTMSDKLRAIATPTVSALGAGLLLLNVVGATVFWPFAPIIALVAGGATGAGLFGGLSQGNRQKLARDVQGAIQRQREKKEPEIQQQFRSEWKQKSDSLRDSVLASKRRLNLFLMQQSPGQDIQIAGKHASLTQSIQRIDRLRRDLRWLEDHAQTMRLVPETEE